MYRESQGHSNLISGHDTALQSGFPVLSEKSRVKTDHVLNLITC